MNVLGNILWLVLGGLSRPSYSLPAIPISMAPPRSQGGGLKIVSLKGGE
mgnify:CR=1 FL=1